MYFISMLTTFKEHKKTFDKTMIKISDKSDIGVRTVNSFLSDRNIEYKHIEVVLSVPEYNLNIHTIKTV